MLSYASIRIEIRGAEPPSLKFCFLNVSGGVALVLPCKLYMTKTNLNMVLQMIQGVQETRLQGQ